MFDTRILIFARSLILVAAIVAAYEAALAQAVVKTNEQLQELRRTLETRKESVVIFFVAKGIPNACGPGCDRWIAAIGDFDAEAPARLRKLLAKYSKSNLPIYFSSPGGNSQAGQAIGRLLRQRKMTAGVAWTFPDECFGAGKSACDRLMRSDGEVLSHLTFSGASCSSACVYALAGGTVREVSLEAKIGVHASLAYSMHRDGTPGVALPGAAGRAYASAKSYFAEMGIDTALNERAQRIPHESIDYLTREEIVRFKLDNRKASESRWLVEEKQRRWFVARKSFFDQRAGREARPNSLELSCDRQEITLSYRRILDSTEMDMRSAIKLVAQNGSIELPETTGSGEPRTGTTRSGIFPVAFFEAAAKGADIEITETFFPNDQAPRTTTTRLSSAGLGDALKILQESCGGSTASTWAPAVSLE